MESGYAVSVTLDEQVEKDVEERMILERGHRKGCRSRRGIGEQDPR